MSPANLPTTTRKERMKTKFYCLALDHDDTTVNSSPEINYPSFLDTLDHLRPGVRFTYEEFMTLCCEPGFNELCRDMLGFDDRDMEFEVNNWREHHAQTIPSAVDGISRLIRRQREAGGIVCVVSHSVRETILRDWHAHFGTEPDAIYDWDNDPEKRKPAPYPLFDIAERYGISPAQILMIDDLLPGAEMARKAGSPCCAAGWGIACDTVRRLMRDNCDYFFDTVSELEDFLFDE